MTVDLSATSLNTGTTNETFKQLGKQDSFMYILKSSASMYESSDIQLNHHWNTIRIRRLWQIKIHYHLFKYLGSYRNIIQFSISSRKAGKGMPDYSRFEFIEKFLANNCFIRYIRQHLRAIEQRRYSRFTFVENPISDLSQISKATFLQSDGLFCFISIYKFDSFKNPFVTTTSLSELYFRFRRFILLVQTKMVISMNYGSSTSC